VPGIDRPLLLLVIGEPQLRLDGPAQCAHGACRSNICCDNAQVAAGDDNDCVRQPARNRRRTSTRKRDFHATNTSQTITRGSLTPTRARDHSAREGRQRHRGIPNAQRARALTFHDVRHPCHDKLFVVADPHCRRMRFADGCIRFQFDSTRDCGPRCVQQRRLISSTCRNPT